MNIYKVNINSKDIPIKTCLKIITNKNQRYYF